MKIKFCPFCGSHAASDRCYACGADLAAVSAACPDIKVSDDMSTVLEFGRYPYTADGAEAAIRWIVLEKTGNAALLLAENVIDCRRFKDGASGARWSECALREWLNGEFLIKAFMEDERDSIVLKVHTDGGNEHCGINGGEEVADSVFFAQYRRDGKIFRSAIYKPRNGYGIRSRTGRVAHGQRLCVLVAPLARRRGRECCQRQ